MGPLERMMVDSIMFLGMLGVWTMAISGMAVMVVVFASWCWMMKCDKDNKT